MLAVRIIGALPPETQKAALLGATLDWNDVVRLICQNVKGWCGYGILRTNGGRWSWVTHQP